MKGESMSDRMTFPDTVEEFFEQYKVVDTDHVYSNGVEFIPIFRIKQWLEHLSSAQPEIVRCKDCKHRPVTNDDYDDDEWDCGFNIEFPDHKCPCRCDDGFYNWLPDDNWFCGNAERRINGH